MDPSRVTGTGPRGAITIADIEAAAKAPAARGAVAPPPDRHAGIRAAIAAAMSRSKREIPHYYLQHTINLHAALQWIDARNADRPATERLLPAAVLIAAVARALGEFPDLNGHFVDGRGAQPIRLSPAPAQWFRVSCVK